MSPLFLPLLGLLAPGCTSTPPAPVGEAPRHAVVIVIDTLRADAMVKAHTPNLDELARAGTEVPHAWASGTWTAPSVVSIFTGSQVREHGWDFPFPTYMDERTSSYPPVPDRVVLAEVLDRAGFVTSGLYGNPLLRNNLGYERGFDTWKWCPDGQVAGAFADLVSDFDDGRRHFVYVHMFGAHQPLRPSKAAMDRWGVDPKLIRRKRGFKATKARTNGPEVLREYQRAYFAVVEDLDRRVGELLTTLEPYRGDTVLVVTSDHGELLGEHGRVGHNRWVWEPLTHVPFIADGAGPLPTELSLAAIPDLLTRALGVLHDWPVKVDVAGPLVAQREGKLAMSEDGRLEGIWDAEAIPSGFAAFDLREDAEERSPVEGQAASFAEKRAAWESGVPSTLLSPANGGMGSDLISALQELGYMDDDE